MHDPGHSGRPSGGAGGVATVVVVGAGGRGLGFCVACDGAAALVLSQHTEPCLQVDVYDTSTDGRSQNAAIRLSRQKPGHLGNGRPAAVVVAGGCLDDDCLDGWVGRGGGGGGCWLDCPSAGAVTQQLLSSPGQYASASTSSQNSANSPLTHSPRHCLLPTGGGGAAAELSAAAVVVAAVVVVDDGGGGRCGALFRLILVEFLSSTTRCSAPANASLDTQHRRPVLHISVTFRTASQ